MPTAIYDGVENKNIMKKGRLVILSGPSGSGKTTLHEKLLKSAKLKSRLVKSVSVTTRTPRGREKDGRDYWFISKKMFMDKRRAGHFLESEKVFGNYYGTPSRNVGNLLKKGKNVLLCIDVKGAKTVSRKHPGALKIFVKTPSLSVLKKRLDKRATEKEVALKIRLSIAKKELQEAKHYDYVVINDHLKKTHRKLERILCKELEIK